MACYPVAALLPGEHTDAHVSVPITAADAIAALYYRHNKPSAVELLPCSLMLTQYRLVLGIAGAPEPLSLPLLGIESWRAVVDSGSAAEAFRSCRRSGTAAGPEPAPVREVVVVSLQTKHALAQRIVFSKDSKMLLRNLQNRLSACAALSAVRQLPAFDLAANARGAAETVASSPMETVSFGWNLYCPAREYARQLCTDAGAATRTAPSTALGGVGRDLRPWFRLDSLTDTSGASPDGGAAVAYSRCPSYPRQVLVPCRVARTTLLAAGTARSRARVPVVSYVHLPSGAVLARSSQPLMRSAALASDCALCSSLLNTGYSRDDLSPSAAVEKTAAAPHRTQTARPPSLFDDGSNDDAAPAARAPSPQSPAASAASSPTALNGPRGALLVADCRPQRTALANAALGGGYESGPYYDPFCRTEFFEIDNIFGVSKAFSKLRAVLLEYQGEDPRYTNFWSDLESSRWLFHIQRVLACSVAVAQSVSRGVSALVHCTDGWDRTSQCCATAMLLLDPFYRTTVGFCLLLEKEFCSFGHKFAERSNHQLACRTSFETHSGVAGSDTEKGAAGGSHSASSSGDKLQPSPIFSQYMDVVHQILHQFPHAFEFTTELLAFLSEAVFSCLYGTFLCNGEQERRLEGVRLGTESVWTYVLRAVQREKAGEAPAYFVNERYDAATAWELLQLKARGPSAEAEAGAETSGACPNVGLLVPSCSPKKLRFWSELYCRWDYTSFQADATCPRARERRQVQPISWGAPFDAFLQSFIDVACEERRSEEPELQTLEHAVSAMARKQSSRSSSSKAAGAQSGDAAPQQQKSEWCRFDSAVCYSCLKELGMFSATAACARCGHNFCGACYQMHQCEHQVRLSMTTEGPGAQ